MFLQTGVWRGAPAEIEFEVAIHTASLVYSHFVATDHTAGRVYICTYFAYIQGVGQ